MTQCEVLNQKHKGIYKICQRRFTPKAVPKPLGGYASFDRIRLSLSPEYATVREYGTGYQYSVSPVTDCRVKLGEQIRRGLVIGKVLATDREAPSLSLSTATDKSVESAKSYLQTVPSRLKRLKRIAAEG